MIDTHLHTNLSDGLETPAEVIGQAAAAGIDLVSITDHDRVTAYPEAIALGRQYGVRVIPGVELTTMDETGFTCVHIVGLGVETGPDVSSVLREIVQAQEEANVGFLENVNRFMAAKHAAWVPFSETRPSIFVNAMRSARSAGIVVSEKELMDVILNRDLWVPVRIELTVDEAVDYVRHWGGVPVLAHPFDFSNDAGTVLKRFLRAGGEAVELCKYRYKVRSSALHLLSSEELLVREREMNLWTIEQARRNGLKLTMASDHHDSVRVMGMDPAEYRIDVSWLYDLAHKP